jgi:hypothetical protein
MTQRLTRQRSRSAPVNTSLNSAGIEPVNTGPTDNHLTWMARLAESRSAAYLQGRSATGVRNINVTDRTDHHGHPSKISLIDEAGRQLVATP